VIDTGTPGNLSACESQRHASVPQELRQSLGDEGRLLQVREFDLAKQMLDWQVKGPGDSQGNAA
jgi:hypothetical protein